jgi:hypothetical protein
VRALEAVIREAESDKTFQKRVEDALSRMQRPKRRFLAGPKPRLDVAKLKVSLGLLEHQMVAEEMRQWL